MKLIKPSFEILEPIGYDIDSIKKFIEICGRSCYKSEDKITKDSAKTFVNGLIKSGHGAMLEHGTIYLYIPWNEYYDKEANFRYFYNKYSVHKRIEGDGVYITTNFRVIIENGWKKDLQYICNPTDYHAKRVTVKFICNRQVSHEFVRHRVFSFAQESTRYCNYTKDKFGKELTFIEPCWLNDDINGDKNLEIIVFKELLINIETSYFELINNGWKVQHAATILPNALKTELIMTGFVDDWKHFFELRADSHAHPQAQELAYPLKDEFIKRGYI